MIKSADILEGCRSYPREPWALLLDKLVTKMQPSPRRSYTLPAARFLATLYIQDKTTADAGIEKWGFSELPQRLSELPETNMLHIKEFDMSEFAARCVFDSDSSMLLGCTIVKKKESTLRTPPAWDGSLDSLKQFNNLTEE